MGQVWTLQIPLFIVFQIPTVICMFVLETQWNILNTPYSFFPNTVRIWHPTIQEPESLKIWTFLTSVFEWFGFQMVGTIVLTIWKLDYLACLDHLINKEKLCFYIKWSRLMDYIKIRLFKMAPKKSWFWLVH